MSYVALHPGYFEALLQIGYEETLTKLKNGFSAGRPLPEVESLSQSL
jgi:hypothetical protein